VQGGPFSKLRLFTLVNSVLWSQWNTTQTHTPPFGPSRPMMMQHSRRWCKFHHTRGVLHLQNIPFCLGLTSSALQPTPSRPSLVRLQVHCYQIGILRNTADIFCVEHEPHAHDWLACSDIIAVPADKVGNSYFLSFTSSQRGASAPRPLCFHFHLLQKC
jgi:hypothetical protein